jgi:hypothetical protein
MRGGAYPGGDGYRDGAARNGNAVDEEADGRGVAVHVERVCMGCGVCGV